jgi:hypothetical protein
MKPDEEWTDWMRGYRHASKPPPAVEAQCIADRAARDRTVHLVKTLIDFAGTAFALLVFAVLCVKFPVVWPLASVVMAGMFVSAGYSFHARVGTFTAADETVLAHVDLALRRKRADVRLLRFGRPLFCVFVIAFAIWLPYSLASRPDERPWRTALHVLAPCAIFAATWIYLHTKLGSERRELERLTALRASLDGEEAEPVEL